MVWRDLFEEYRKAILGAKLLMVEGHLQIEGEVVHVIAQRCHNLDPLLGLLTSYNDEDAPVETLARDDERDGAWKGKDGNRTPWPGKEF